MRIDTASLIFCLGALLVSLAVAWLAYPYAALPVDVARAATDGVPAEELGMVELGDGFGSVHAVELLGYYLENPPAPEGAAAAPAPERRFGGC